MTGPDDHTLAGPPSERLAVGRITRPWGIRGHVFVTAFGNGLAHMRIPAELFLGSGEGDMRAATLDDVRMTSSGMACRFTGSTSVETAESLRGLVIYAPVRLLDTLKKGEFYQYELEQMTVYAGSYDHVFGTVRGVIEYPTVNALEITTAEGKQVLIPFTRTAVKEIDREKKAIVIDAGILAELL